MVAITTATTIAITSSTKIYGCQSDALKTGKGDREGEVEQNGTKALTDSSPDKTVKCPAPASPPLLVLPPFCPSPFASKAVSNDDNEENNNNNNGRPRRRRRRKKRRKEMDSLNNNNSSQTTAHSLAAQIEKRSSLLLLLFECLRIFPPLLWKRYGGGGGSNALSAQKLD